MSSAFGAELRRLWERPPSVSRPVKGWHAQISALTKTPRGYEAAHQVGLHVKQRRTLEGWLAKVTEPTSANKRLINAAYRLMTGQWDESMERREYSIVGLIDSGDRTEHRELIIDGRAGDWQPIMDAYLDGADDDELEELFIEYVIEEDIGDGSGDGWGFPGDSYEILI